MRRTGTGLLAGVAGLMGAPAAESAELPDRKAGPIPYLRVCKDFGSSFFYIPGTETCLRLSGRARWEYGYQPSYSRTQNAAGATPGDYSGHRGNARINIDARTQTGYGTLRSFLRIEAASRTGFATMHAGALNRIAIAYPATGIDAFGRVQQQLNVDKAFVQFSGFTAGRASSFFDFYAHDFEFIVATMGSDQPSTNLAAYTAKVGDGLSATISMEDPVYRQTPVFSAQNAVVTRAVADSGQTAAPQPTPITPVFVGYGLDGQPSGVGFLGTAQPVRMPDFVGALRYDQKWGSAQLSAAVHEISTGGFLATFAGTNRGEPVSLANSAGARPPSAYGWAVQGGLKLNLPFIAPGDTLYLQGAYGQGAALYTGLPAYNGPWLQAASAIQGAAFSQFLNDAVINPFTSRLELSTSVSVTASLLHYWSPTVRSALFGSYGTMTFAPGARFAQGAYAGLTGTGPGQPGTRFFALNQVLRDNYRFVVGANLIWSPIKNLDIGLETIYTRYGPQRGRVLDLGRFPGQNAAYVNNPANPVLTATQVDTVQVRARVQRDF